MISSAIVHLSDLHIGATWAATDAVERLEAAIRAARASVPRPAAVLVSGDISDRGASEDYLRAKELLARFDAPVIVIPGNHDHRATMRRHFDLPGAGDEPIRYSVRVGGMRVVAVDSIVPGADHGTFTTDISEWLEHELSSEPDTPTLLAMHHPPIATGIPWGDAIGIPAEERDALAQVLRRHPQVERIAAGHIHCVVTGTVGHASVLTIPSTYIQVQLALDSPRPQFTDSPAGYAVHAMVDGALRSTVQFVSGSIARA